MTSLEGVCRLAVSTAELGVSVLASDRGLPLFTLVNGPDACPCRRERIVVSGEGEGTVVWYTVVRQVILGVWHFQASGRQMSVFASS